MSYTQLESREYMIHEIMEWDDPDWLVQGFVEEHSCVFISAQPKVGKSFFALRLAAAVSSGTPLFGHHTKQGHILYLAAERAYLMKRRIQAIKERGLPIDDAHFRLWPDPVIFSDHTAVRDFVRSLKTVPDLLIVDTLRRCNDGDERDNTHMSQWTRGIELFRDLTGASVVVIHHDHRESYSVHGKKLQSSFSGAGSILGNLDGYFSVRPQTNGTIIVGSEGSNEMTEFRATVRIENVDLGLGRSTGVMVEVDGDGGIEGQPDLAELAINILREYPRTIQQNWLALCKADETIRSWWPKLNMSSLTRIKQEHASMIREEPNSGHKQQPFLSVVEIAQPTIA